MSVASASISSALSAASATAGAVLRPAGSSRMAEAGIPKRAHLFGHGEAMGFVAHDDRRDGVGNGSQACRGVLQHGLLAGESQQLFRIHLPGQWPEPRAGAARENHRDYSGQDLLTLRASPYRSHNSQNPPSASVRDHRDCARRRSPGERSVALMWSKSGLRNSRHSVTMAKASAPCSASSAVLQSVRSVRSP